MHEKLRSILLLVRRPLPNTLHDFCCYPAACHFVKFGTSVICNLFMHCLGPFSINYKTVLVSKLVFAFAELNMRFSVNLLRISILHYCDAGFGCLIRTVCKYSTYLSSP